MAYRYRTNPQERQRKAERASAHHRANYIPVRHYCVCVVCGSQFRSRTSLARYCSGRCRYRQHYLGRRARHRSAEREPYTVVEIGDRDGWVCGLCGEPVDRLLTYPDLWSPSIDHVIPLALGGSDRRENVQLSHLQCNRRKGARLVSAELVNR